MFKRCLLLLSLLFLTSSIFDISLLGAVPNSDSLQAQFLNQQALTKAISLANSTTTQQRIVKIPSHKYYAMPVRTNNAHNITIIIQGRWIASKIVKHWPKQPNTKGYYQDFLSFHQCSHITITGGGKIDGRGYHWWILTLFQPNKLLTDQNQRPHLIRMVNTNFTHIHDIVMKNSAQFHLKMDQCHDGLLYNIAIKVNTTAQINLIKKFSLQGSIIMFPLNTDGIDPAGARFHIYNITCQNYDDVVVPKPQPENDCTRDFMVENCTVILGVGMTIGSVPPKQGCNCIRNVTFRNVRMIRPLKGIYVKTNPGDKGTGLIQDILYSNFTMDRPVWWAIYIGPQQMKQPDGDGPGCMLYPLGTCQTQPRVTLKNITLENISIHNSLLYPYTVRCNASNPCQDINFYNVRTDKWKIGLKNKGYICQFVMGKRDSKTYPNMACLDLVNRQTQQQVVQQGQQVQQVQQVEQHVQQQQKRTIFDDYFERTLTGFKLGRLLFQQLQKAAHEVGYYDQHDDQFDYDLSQTGYDDVSIASLMEQRSRR